MLDDRFSLDTAGRKGNYRNPFTEARQEQASSAQLRETANRLKAEAKHLEDVAFISGTLGTVIGFETGGLGTLALDLLGAFWADSAKNKQEEARVAEEKAKLEEIKEREQQKEFDKFNDSLKDGTASGERINDYGRDGEIWA